MVDRTSLQTIIYDAILIALTRRGFLYLALPITPCALTFPSLETSCKPLRRREQAANKKQEICFEKDRFEPEVNEVLRRVCSAGYLPVRKCVAESVAKFAENREIKRTLKLFYVQDSNNSLHAL